MFPDLKEWSKGNHGFPLKEGSWGTMGSPVRSRCYPRNSLRRHLHPLSPIPTPSWSH